MIGTTIKGYQVSGLLGQGGMANVYEGIVNERLGTKVAIKVLHPTLALEPTIRQRFEQEALSMAQLKHPYIAKVVDFIDEDNMLAMILEYLDGMSLREYILKYGPIDPREALRTFGKVLDAFAYVHEKEIVHRDVKPSNIFLTVEGEPKVLDFGIAKLVSSSKLKTRTGVQIGTPLYMSPEQVKNPRSIDHRTDIYSLGVTLHHMLSGTPPYDHQNTSEWEIQTKIVKEPLPELPNMPRRLNDIIQKATAKEPDERYQSCTEFKQAFRSKPPQPKKTKSSPIRKVVDATVVDVPEELKLNVPRSIQIKGKPKDEVKQKVVSPQRPKKKQIRRVDVQTEEGQWLNARYKTFRRNYTLGIIGIIFSLVFGLAIDIFSGYAREDEMGLFVIILLLATVFLIISTIAALRIVHRGWKLIQDQHASTTPGKAIGFLFIPFFNLYWIFVAYRSLAVELNNYLINHAKIRIAKEGTVLAYCILSVCSLIPGIVLIALPVNILLWSASIKTIKRAAVAVAEIRG